MSGKEKFTKKQVMIRLSLANTKTDLEAELKEIKNNLNEDYSEMIRQIAREDSSIGQKLDMLPSSPY